MTPQVIEAATRLKAEAIANGEDDQFTRDLITVADAVAALEKPGAGAEQIAHEAAIEMLPQLITTARNKSADAAIAMFAQALTEHAAAARTLAIEECAKLMKAVGTFVDRFDGDGQPYGFDDPDMWGDLQTICAEYKDARIRDLGGSK